MGVGIEMVHDSPTLQLHDLKSQVDSNGDDCFDYEPENAAKNDFHD